MCNHAPAIGPLYTILTVSFCVYLLNHSYPFPDKHRRRLNPSGYGARFKSWPGFLIALGHIRFREENTILILDSFKGWAFRLTTGRQISSQSTPGESFSALLTPGGSNSAHVPWNKAPAKPRKFCKGFKIKYRIGNQELLLPYELRSRYRKTSSFAEFERSRRNISLKVSLVQQNQSNALHHNQASKVFSQKYSNTLITTYDTWFRDPKNLRWNFVFLFESLKRCGGQ